jgi:hypothetical protein
MLLARHFLPVRRRDCVRPALSPTADADLFDSNPPAQMIAPAVFRTEAGYRLNTNSIDAVEVFLSSGDNGMMLGAWREPTRTATYCLPFTE